MFCFINKTINSILLLYGETKFEEKTLDLNVTTARVVKRVEENSPHVICSPPSIYFCLHVASVAVFFKAAMEYFYLLQLRGSRPKEVILFVCRQAKT